LLLGVVVDRPLPDPWQVARMPGRVGVDMVCALVEVFQDREPGQVNLLLMRRRSAQRAPRRNPRDLVKAREAEPVRQDGRAWQ
jgi:hypothetical protein